MADASSTLIIVVIVALIFDYVNGWNDSANAIATVVSTRVLAPLTAVLFAAILNFAGAFASERVANMIGKGIVDPEAVTPVIVLGAMAAAALWVAFCTRLGLPISGSHSLVGGLVGAVVASVGWDVLNSSGINKILIAMLVSPLLGFAVGFVFLVIVYCVAYVMTRQQVRKSFGFLQIVSAGFMAFTHGMNDAQKVMGVITMAMIADGVLSPDAAMPLWVIVACATAMGVGTAAGGWRVIKTLGMNLAHIRPIEGFAAETAAGIVLSGAAMFGVPVSTTHTITASILGVGTARNAKGVHWGIGAKIVYAWVFTLPAAAGLAAVLTIFLEWAMGKGT